MIPANDIHERFGELERENGRLKAEKEIADRDIERWRAMVQCRDLVNRQCHERLTEARLQVAEYKHRLEVLELKLEQAAGSEEDLRKAVEMIARLQAKLMKAGIEP